VAWWRAENNADDSVGTHPGTATGGVAYVAGTAGQAFSLDGSDDSVNVGSWFNFQSFTISMWVNPAASQQQYADIIDNNHSSNPAHSWVMQQGSATNQYSFYGYSSTIGDVSAFPEVSFTLPANQWTHVAVTRDGSTRMGTVYLNGIAQPNVTGTTDINYDGTQNLHFGRHDSLGRNWAGKLDEIRIYNRALTANEVENLAGFNFISQTGMPRSTVIVSNPVTVSFISDEAAISISSGEYSISTNGGSIWEDWTGESDTVSPGNLVKVRLTSSASYLATSTAILTIGSFSSGFKVTTAASGDPNASGLISWWKAENNAYDSLGDNHGTAMNGATYATGKIGQAFSFDGADDYISVPNNPLPGSIAISAWINSSDNSGQNRLIIGENVGIQGTGWQFFIQAGGRLVFGIYAPGWTFVTSSFDLPVNQWVHVAATFNAVTGTMQLYINGVPDTTNQYTGGLWAANTNPLKIGSLGTPTGAAPFSGRIDEVKIFNRVLTVGEVVNQAGFNFIAQTGVPLSTLIVSNPVTVSFISGISSISISDGSQYAISTDGGSSWGSWITSGTINPGAVVMFRQTSSSSASTTTSATLTIGGITMDFSVTTAAAGDPDANGLVSWWRAEDNAHDSVGGNHGTPMNGATYATGKDGQAFSFDGVDDYVLVPNSPSLNIGAGDFSLTLWANYAAVRSGPYGSLANVFIGQDEGSGGNHKWVFYSADGGLYFHINNSGNTFLGPFAFTPQTGQWYHLTVTRSAALYSFYVNGTLAGTMTNSTSIPDVNAPLTIGQAEGIGYFNGLIDEVKIYNRALSASEVKNLAGKYTLTITKDGTGSGTVTSSPSGIDCGSTCSYPFGYGTPVDIIAAADSNSGLIDYTVDCNANHSPCKVVMDSAKAVTVTFKLKTDFDATPLSGQAPMAVQFTDRSISGATSWAWTFGDGGTSTLQNPLHMYKTASSYPVSYPVSLTANGSTTTKSDYITLTAVCGDGPYKIGGTMYYYDTIQHAYEAPGSTGIIEIQAMEFLGGLSMTQGKEVTLRGGYGCDFTSNPGYTIIRGQMTIRLDKVTVDKIIIK
jgi:PKD repeat protein